MTDKKKCTACKKGKPLSDFNVNRKRADGYQSECKKCQKEYYDDWLKKNPGYHQSWYQRRKGNS